MNDVQPETTIKGSGRRLPILMAILVVIVGAAVVAEASRVHASPHASSRERQFIDSVRSSLEARYPTTGQAVRAGYFDITGIDEDGTAVYFNPHIRRVDAVHPNFLWYDKRGRLVGLDYEFTKSQYPKPPSADFPVSPGRWTTVKEHVHFNYRVGHGPIRMGMSHVRPNLRANPITAAELRADHLLPPNAHLVWAYAHPTNWDLGFWLVPNPNGAFAEKNPNVQK